MNNKVNKIKESYNLSGILELAEHDYEYILKNDDNTAQFNLSVMLERLYADDETIDIQVSFGNTIEFVGQGRLFKIQDKDSIISFFIDGENLDKFLFDHTEIPMEIKIDVLDMEDEK
mgnify:CR=1 FL=1